MQVLHISQFESKMLISGESLCLCQIERLVFKIEKFSF